MIHRRPVVFRELKKCHQGAYVEGILNILGHDHHVLFIELWCPGGKAQRPVDDPRRLFDQSAELFWDEDKNVQTVEVPGFTGQYAMLVFPHEV